MYNKEICLTVKYKGITLECECTVSAVKYQKYKTSTEDVIESIDAVLHAAEDIQELLSAESINELYELCYEQYYK